MKPGVKCGPANWTEALQTDQVQMAEIWFRWDQLDQYDQMFEFMKAEKIEFGLHFWGILEGGYEPNLAYPGEKFAQASSKQISQCIDIASQVGAVYVNAHPGSLQMKFLDLDGQCHKPTTWPEANYDEALTSLLEQTQKLHAQAQAQGVVFTLETLPSREGQHWRDETGRLITQDFGSVDMQMMLALANHGFFVANDFCHTVAQLVNHPQEAMFKFLYDWTVKLAPQTKLIHVNTTIPPFNGTDSHHGILSSDYEQAVFPQKDQLLQLLSLFSHREDVWVIPEPQMNAMLQNYQELVKILQEIKTP